MRQIRRRIYCCGADRHTVRPGTTAPAQRRWRRRLAQSRPTRRTPQSEPVRFYRKRDLPAARQHPRNSGCIRRDGYVRDC